MVCSQKVSEEHFENKPEQEQNVRKKKKAYSTDAHSHTPLYKEGIPTVTQWFKPLHPPWRSSIAEAINNHRRLLGVVADSLIHVTTFIKPSVSTAVDRHEASVAQSSSQVKASGELPHSH